MEITISWACLLLAEWLIALKYFDVSSQLPAVTSGKKEIKDINASGSFIVKLCGGIANVLVSIWPGILFAATFYKKTTEDISQIFYEFQIAIWLNAICRLISLGVFGVAMCRISDAVKNIQGLKSDGTFICLNWALIILTASVQISLMVFYALGLIYKDSETLKHYTNLMMYINIGCTCAAQIILSYIFAQMSEEIQVYETPGKDGRSDV